MKRGMCGVRLWLLNIVERGLSATWTTRCTWFVIGQKAWLR